MNKLILLALWLLCFPVSTLAYKVKSISGSKILVDLENEKLFVGDSILSINKTTDGPEITGSAKVLQVRPGQAVAVIQDGKFIIGGKVARKAAAPIATPPPKPKTDTDAEYMEDEEIYETSQAQRQRFKALDEENIILRRDLIKVSLLGVFSYDKISAKQQEDVSVGPFPQEETVPMNGNSSGYGVSVDYPTRWGFTLRGVALYEKLSVSGQSNLANVCAGKTSQHCAADVTYLSLSGLGRYDFYFHRTTLWVGAGGVFKFPTAKETTALRQEDLKVANALVLATGFEFAFNNKYFMPISYEYHYSLNKSPTVPVIDHSAFSVGYGFKF